MNCCEVTAYSTASVLLGTAEWVFKCVPLEYSARLAARKSTNPPVLSSAHLPTHRGMVLGTLLKRFYVCLIVVLPSQECRHVGSKLDAHFPTKIDDRKGDAW